MRKAGMRSDAVVTRRSTSAMANRSAKPFRSLRGWYSGARAQCSRTNSSGSPTQRRSALPVDAVGIAAKATVGDIRAVGIRAVGVGPVGVGPVGVGPVGVAARAAVREVGPVHAIRAVGPVRVPARRIGSVDGVAGPRAGGVALRGGDVVVSEGRVVSAHREASSEGPGRALVGG